MIELNMIEKIRQLIEIKGCTNGNFSKFYLKTRIKYDTNYFIFCFLF